ncbi:MAG: DUF3987 domain-containing protein [Bacteroidales bacterium]|nr:DUF3987 domain-containing protein [Bacteroidales bacterium]
MSRKTFNPSDWSDIQPPDPDAAKPDSGPLTPSLPHAVTSGAERDIEQITRRIEAAAADIAPTYAEWRDLGFALADALGEGGRTYYQRISRFYPEYSESGTDRQYTACLHAHGHGITVKTLFHLARKAGISIQAAVPDSRKNGPGFPESPKSSKSPAGDLGEMEEMPTFSQEIAGSLPSFLSQVVSHADSPEDADLLLLGALTVFSSCLPNIRGIYDGREVFPNLFLFVAAQASAGKGRLSLCRHLVGPIHQKKREQYAAEMERYKRQLADFVVNKKKTDAEQPAEPPFRTLFIPANSSSTAVYQTLNDNGGAGLIFETEGDTLANTFKSDFGNYSDGFRKAFHHETISYNRRKDKEFVELSQPRLSALLSGTPRQIQTLIPDAENGLFSRFIFYCRNVRIEWKDVFAVRETALDSFFEHLGKRFSDLHQFLQSSQPLLFVLSDAQQADFNAFFGRIQHEYASVFGLDILASVRRLGLIAFRIAMILTSLRIYDGKTMEGCLVCGDSDYRTTITMVGVLLQHTAKVLGLLSAAGTDAPAGAPALARQKFLECLPPEFDRQAYLAVAGKLGIPAKTAEKHISRFCATGRLKHTAHGHYAKV